MIPVQTIANSILKKAFEEDIPISPMKLQKLIYFVYKDYIQKTQCPLFEEKFLTWQYGPVVKSVYDYFKSFGRNPINRFSRDAKGDVFWVDDSKPNDVIKSIDKIWGLYKNYSGIELSEITHSPNTAWYNAYMNNKPFLDDEDIQNDRQ